MNTKLLVSLLLLSIGFIIFTNYRKLEIQTKVSKVEIELDTNIDQRIQENFSNLPEINFTTDSNFYQNTTYLSTMNQVNRKARNFESPNHALQMCVQAYQTIPKSEKNNAQKLVFQLLEKTSIASPNYNKYLKHWLTKIKIAKQKNWLEAGMPHTHLDIVILNPNWFQIPRRSTLVHEMTHVHQRLNPNDYLPLFEKWGFIYYPRGINTIKGLEDKFILSRHNPDGIDLNWIWKTPKNTYYWITAQFIRGDQISLTDVEYLAYQLETDSYGNYFYLNKIPIPLKQWKLFQDYFQIGNNHYHPNEIAAQYAEFYLEEHLGDTGNINKSVKTTPGYQIYTEFMNELITRY